MSVRSSTNVPPSAPAPERKSNRSAEIPSGGRARNAAATTALRRLPPKRGCGWSRTAAPRGLAAGARSAVERDAVGSRQGDGSGGRIHEAGRYSHDVVSSPDDKLPIKMLNDRLLVRIPDKDGERRTQGGILIPATAQMAKRLVWAEVVALGQNVRSAEVGDLVLFSPEDRYEVEVQGSDYIMLRERDLHAVAAERIEAGTGLYL